MTKRGYSVNLAILLAVAISGVLLPAGDASADCRWFQVGGLTPNADVLDITSSDPACISVDSIPQTVNASGEIKFKLCPELPDCGSCSGDVLIAIEVDGAALSFFARCVFCDSGGPPFSAPTVDGCIADICTEPGGKNAGSAIDITACTFPDCNQNGVPDGSEPDSDGDGVIDDCDNCPGDANPDQADGDGDGAGDVCDPCPLDNPDDSDLDGVCDSNDVCPGFDDNLDCDSDGIPDGCEPDCDGDGVPDDCDTPLTINVPDPGNGINSIQDGIDAACDGDEIIVAPGTYNEAINFLGKAITLRSTDPTDPAVVAATIIDATGFTTTVVRGTAGGPDTVLDGFTIKGGRGLPSGGNTVGGGMFNAGSSPTVTNCTFRGNLATSGAGMFNENSSPTVTNCTFSGNTGANGGGMVNIDNSSPTVTNCTFSENTAFDGGGMYNINSSPTVTNCTFSGNFCVLYGGGMFNSVFSSPTLANCVLWGDIAFTAGNEIAGSSATIHYCDIVGSGGSGDGWDASLGTDLGGNIDAEPLFVDPDGPDNIPGTEDDDLRLLPGSPCIDAANNLAVPPDTPDLDGDGDTTEPIPFDLDGNPRFFDDPDTPDTGNPDGVNPIVDMGAYEFQGTSFTADISGPLGPDFPDGCVDAFDLGAMLGAWCSGVNDPNPPSPPCENCTPANLAIADISGAGNVPDGCVDAFDLAKLLAEWCSVAGGNPCGTCGP